jgi:thiol-disulfide isomerase/thioredoxin
MGKNVKRAAVVVFCLVMLAALGITELSAATKVPDFSFPSIPGNERIDIRDFRGKVVLVNFWATWCSPCVQEMPSLQELHEKYGPKGFSVIGISVDQGGSKLVEKMTKKLGVTYPVVIGDTQTGRDFGGIFGVPTSFLIDRSGNVLKRYTGLISLDVFEEDIKAALR